MKPTAIIVLLLVWLGTIGGAYFLGSNNSQSTTGTTAVQASTPRPSGPLLPSTSNRLSAGAGTKTESDDQAAGPVDVSSLMKKAQMMMGSGGMMNFNGLIDVGTMLKTIPYDQIPDAIAEAEAIKNPQTKQGIIMMLMSRWAEKDGRAALAHAEKMEKVSGGGMLGGAGAKMAVLQTWGQREPDAAWEWYLEDSKSNKNGGMFGGSGMALVGIFNGLVSKDPAAAFERLGQVEDMQSRQMALGGMMQHITDPKVQEALGTYLTSLDETDRAMTTQGVMGQWAMLDPEGMMKFAESRPDDERKDLVRQAGQTMLFTDPDKGIDMILKNSDEKDLPQSYQMITQSIASRDPAKAEAWINDQPQGPELDPAKNSYALTVAQRDPESAMALAKTITDENSRTETVGQVYKQWYQKDAAAADAALPESGLSAEAVELLLQEIDAAGQGSVKGAAIGGFIGN
ncbi:MAG: hypothetical protein KDN22_02565 [Verrucomicrobiae bacterium]|nr:hypothetical protein [Verrucomicrobiae bacterium]